MSYLIDNFLMKYVVRETAVQDVLYRSGIGEKTALIDVLIYLETLKETHPHYFTKYFRND